jgi:hypothetical protein
MEYIIYKIYLKNNNLFLININNEDLKFININVNNDLNYIRKILKNGKLINYPIKQIKIILFYSI